MYLSRSNGANILISLVKEAAIKSKQSGDRGLTARSVRKVTRVCHIAFQTHSLRQVLISHICRIPWLGSRAEGAFMTKYARSGCTKMPQDYAMQPSTSSLKLASLGLLIQALSYHARAKSPVGQYRVGSTAVRIRRRVDSHYGAIQSWCGEG